MESHTSFDLASVEAQLQSAIDAPKCHRCGCFASTLTGLASADDTPSSIKALLERGRSVLEPPKYECLGCEVCYPAVAANLLAEALPDVLSELALCPTAAPEERSGWPPLPGHFFVVRYSGSVAVCTLNSDALSQDLAQRRPAGLAIAGTLHTENLGIERIIRNVTANPNIRFLILCGEDTQRLVGHLPGRAFESLFANGVDGQMRIIGAPSKRPYLKNVSLAQVECFRAQVELVSKIGEQNVDDIEAGIADCHRKARPAFAVEGSFEGPTTVRAAEPKLFKADPAGYFVVYPDRSRMELVVEHYSNAGVLDCIIAGVTPVAVYYEIIKRGLVSQLDHAAYLGRELASAQRALDTGIDYVQDAAPGVEASSAAADCGPSCKSCH